MADLARALQTPVPAQPAPQQPAPQGAGEKAAVTRADNAKREAKNERDRLRRKAKRAADLKAAKAAEKQAAAPKRERKKKKPTDIYDAMKAAAARNPMKKRRVGKSTALAAPYGKKRRRGRPPGAKNKPKVGLAVALVPAPGVLPRTRQKPTAPPDSLLVQINLAVTLLNAMPEHARKVVLDAVK